MSGARPATGEQIHLQHGDFRATVGQVAAVLRAFSRGGIRYTETWAEAEPAPSGCGIVLVPWPNRVADGRWSHRGAVQQLDLTEPSRNNAIHGLLRNTAYAIVDRASDRVTLGAPVYPQHGYPFTLDTGVTYALSDTGLTVTHRITNVGSDTAPVGIGTHPFLRVGETPVEDLVLTIAADTYQQVDDRLLPTATAPVGPGTDLRSGVRVGELALDTAFTDIAQVDGRFRHTLRAPDGGGVTLWAEPDFGWAQVYTADAFPGQGGPRRAVAVEPVTCAVDAFNSGIGLHHLTPGETWSTSWGLTPL